MSAATIELHANLITDSVASLTISNQFQELTQVAIWLVEASQVFELSEQVQFKLDLVLNEALPNIISYAYQDALPHKIQLRLKNTADKVWLEIVDDGVPFNPFDMSSHVESLALETASPSGRGIHLIKSYTDEQYHQYMNGQNMMRVAVAKAQGVS